MNALELQGLTKHYKDFTLGPLDLTLPGGTICGLIGENGAGKSTLLNLIGGMDIPTTGQVIVDGEDISKYNEDKLSRYRAATVGFIFQFYNILPTLTVLENVELVKDIVRNPLDAHEALEKVGLTEHENKFPNQLSGGEQQRIAIARAYFMDSEFVILDEPTSALDPIAENAMYENIASILTQKSCIFISHRLASAKMADRILVLSKGQIQEEGSHAELMERGGIYADMYRMQSSWYENHGSERECDEENRKYI